MQLSVEATYENGVLRPSEALPLDEHQRVRITLEVEQSWARRTAGMMKWTGDAETLRRLTEDPEFGILESP